MKFTPWLRTTVLCKTQDALCQKAVKHLRWIGYRFRLSACGQFAT